MTSPAGAMPYTYGLQFEQLQDPSDPDSWATVTAPMPDEATAESQIAYYANYFGESARNFTVVRAPSPDWFDWNEGDPTDDAVFSFGWSYTAPVYPYTVPPTYETQIAPAISYEQMQGGWAENQARPEEERMTDLKRIYAAKVEWQPVPTTPSQ
ncbi:hypothetical protein I5G62_gp35 [Mycobacterium phage CRB2]|uniref:Uncharacterized protein n=1 Tax=Mycobacterium phage CRB2 TaxID=2483623 RepID=A0A455M846_9CAUD|nr:hypothetical protein I5G62_gp35 [Mycobacterium phage CRB2]AYP70021.1 hypothetical protein CRB2_35 [Mycobacterium phage CRB2]